MFSRRRTIYLKIKKNHISNPFTLNDFAEIGAHLMSDSEVQILKLERLNTDSTSQTDGRTNVLRLFCLGIAVFDCLSYSAHTNAHK